MVILKSLSSIAGPLENKAKTLKDFKEFSTIQWNKNGTKEEKFVEPDEKNIFGRFLMQQENEKQNKL